MLYAFLRNLPYFYINELSRINSYAITVLYATSDISHLISLSTSKRVFQVLIGFTSYSNPEQLSMTEQIRGKGLIFLNYSRHHAITCPHLSARHPRWTSKLGTCRRSWFPRPCPRKASTCPCPCNAAAASWDTPGLKEKSISFSCRHQRWFLEENLPF